MNWRLIRCLAYTQAPFASHVFPSSLDYGVVTSSLDPSDSLLRRFWIRIGFAIWIYYYGLIVQTMGLSYWLLWKEAALSKVYKYFVILFVIFSS